MGKAIQTFICALLINTALFAYPLQTNDASYEFRQIANSPEIYECEHFLSDAECDDIIERAKPTLSRSTVIDDNSSQSLVDGRRTSLGTFLPKSSEGPVVHRIRKMIEKITGIPKKNGEGLQVLHYSIGAEYQPHFDYFDPSSPGGDIHFNRGGQRVATLLLYLNTPTKGGETIFPKAKVQITPKKGKAVLFYNVNLQGIPDPNSLHGGAPVLSGEKWIATLWLREDTFR